MDSAIASTRSGARLGLGPWLWGPGADLAVFGGSALLALGLVVVARALSLGESLPEWGWLAFVLAIDVAHVYSTLFRTYLDPDELRGRALRYFALPAALYAAAVALYAAGPLLFWRVLAYLAVFHFVRQQVGWVAVYRARAQQRGTLDVWLDSAATYLAAGYPLLVWHARLEHTRFAWFVEGDFIDVASSAQALLPFVRIAWAAALCAFAARQLQLALTTGTLQLGKTLVVATTALTWYVGIVATNSDFEFTVTNVIVHGVPYLALVWAYARERRRDVSHAPGSQIIAGGLAAFLGVLLVLAFVEEWAWDRYVWHERGWLFGGGAAELSALALTLLVPALALPQLTHYVLDGLLWRRADSRRLRAQRRALGYPE